MMIVTKLLPLVAAAVLAMDGVHAADGGGSSSVTLYAIIGVVVLLFIGAAIFVWQRNKKRGQADIEAQQRAVPARPPAAANDRRGARDNAQAYRSHQSPAAAQRPAHARPPSSHSSSDRKDQAEQPPRRMNDYAPAPPRQPTRPTPAPAPPQRQHAAEPPANNNKNKTKEPTAKSREVAARVLAEFQSDPSLSRRRVPYSALYFTRVLSKGAFGEVWLAQLENRQVAVKRILSEKKNDEKEIECFGAEIKLMASFSHPKIVEFVGVSWSTLQDLCAVTEYMAKGDLYGFLKRKNGQLNWRDHKIYLAEDVADALGYLHSLTPVVIHRDLKSKNILLDDSFRAKLSDFGISRERSLEETMTAGVGTIYWTAPEVLMGRKYTEKADIFSFGICMSELDTHEVPYSDMRDDAGKKLQGMKIVQMVIKKKLRPTFSPDCPAIVRDLATRCLDSEPDNRPDAFELLRLIQQIQQQL